MDEGVDNQQSEARDREILGLLISVDVAAAMRPRQIVRYGEVAEDRIPSRARRRLLRVLRLLSRRLRRLIGIRSRPQPLQGSPAESVSVCAEPPPVDAERQQPAA